MHNKFIQKYVFLCKNKPILSFFSFTLAEVLITLVVIGVIASITVPMMMTNYQKNATVSGLKKMYSTLSQATNLAIMDNGPITGWTIDKGNDVFLKTYTFPYIDLAKDCGNSTEGECSFKYKTIKGEEIELSDEYNRFFLKDGNRVAVITASFANQRYAYYIVDINGLAKPNRMGRDIFVFVYFIYRSDDPVNHNGKFMNCYPFWDRERIKTYFQTGCNRVSTGQLANYSCAALIMNDGWEIKGDYPW